MSSRNNAPALCASSEISSTGVSAPVEVSAWTMATNFGLATFLSASAICCGVMICPQGDSTLVTFAPQRSATSHMRVPKTPLTPMMTSSPGSMRLTQQNSMPALPVPLTGKVMSFFVMNTARSIVLISSISFTKTGSRWPTSGCAMARRTAGATSLGPGPSSRRGGGLN